MNHILSQAVLFFIIYLTLGFTQVKKPISSYATGERLIYRVHYGLINAGEAKIEIHDKIHNINDKPCVKAVCTGKTTGAFDLMMRVKDSWGSYIDTISQTPVKGFRDIQEGKYRLKENSTFDFINNAVTVEREMDKKTSAVFKIPNKVE